MTSLENLENEAFENNIEIIEKPFHSSKIKGLYCDGVIALNSNLTDSAEKSCILAEELGHHYTTVGDILDQSDAMNRKQELRSRLWAYNRHVGLQGIIRAYQAHRTSSDEMADFLEVTPAFLLEALECYRSKYSPCITVDNYIIFFAPCLAVAEIVR